MLSGKQQQTIVITGAFSYTGKYTTRLLLARGHAVRTLTSHRNRESSFAAQVAAFPYNFEDPDRLVDSLRGASTLINTYWVRFPHAGLTFETAVQNTLVLIDAAKRAGVRRLVHVSIANPSLDSPLGYYRGKAELERAVVDSELSYAIVRPTVIFGSEDILINNIAWFLRHFPIFVIPGDGQYQVRPIYVEDMASLLVRAAEGQSDDVLDAVGPETFIFEELVRSIAAACGKSPRVLHAPAGLSYAATRAAGWLLRDVVLTWQEYRGLMAGLLAPNGPATGDTRLTTWLAENSASVGRVYASELARHYRPMRMQRGQRR